MTAAVGEESIDLAVEVNNTVEDSDGKVRGIKKGRG